MANSDLTTLLDLPDAVVTGFERDEQGHWVFDVGHRWRVAMCPHCAKVSTKLHDYGEWRLIRDCPVFGQETYLRVRTRRFKCPIDGHPFTEVLGWAAPNSHYTHRYEAYVFALCKRNTLLEVSRLEGLSEEVVERIFNRLGKEKAVFPPTATSESHQL